MIYFSNPGSFDIRLLSVFGVSAKPNSSNPIGKFGTGLKNAVAGVLRLGGTITIHSEGTEHTIHAKGDTFRGQDHQMVYMDDTQLSFSLALGAHWEPWMIYREFYSNQLDEGGPDLPSRSYPSDGGVVFCINCPEVEAILSQHTDYFLNTSPMATLGPVEIHSPSLGGHKGKVFLNHILVHSSEKPFLYTYNFIGGLSLTEDRTVHDWDIRYTLVQALANHTGPSEAEIIKTILEAGHQLKEYDLDFSCVYSATENFKKVLGSSVRAGKANRSALSYGRAYLEDIGYKTEVKDAEQAKLLIKVDAATRELLSEASSTLPEPLIFLSSEVEDSELWIVFKENIYLHPSAFASQSTLFKALFQAYSSMLDESPIFFLLEDMAFGKEAAHAE